MKYLLSAIAVIAGFALSTTATAGGFYIATFGGLNIDDVISSPIVSDNNGYAIGAAIGTPINSIPGLSIEGEMSFRQNDVTLFKVFDASHETFAVMANAVYELPVNVKSFHPYILGGLGYGHSQAVFENISLLKIETSGLAWQLGAGADVDVAENVRIGLAYRFFQAEPTEILGTEISDGSNHSIVATVKFAL